jgi:hypothetical protein
MMLGKKERKFVEVTVNKPWKVDNIFLKLLSDPVIRFAISKEGEIHLGIVVF